jgi:hypothetical protein
MLSALGCYSYGYKYGVRLILYPTRGQVHISESQCRTPIVLALDLANDIAAGAIVQFQAHLPAVLGFFEQFTE